MPYPIGAAHVAIELILRKRFGKEGLTVMPKVQHIHDAAKLEEIMDLALTVRSSAELSVILAADNER